jgi:septal ring factor EnvC (AmiA/AmiB activator)
MNKKIKQLEQSIQTKETKRDSLTEQIKEEKAQLKELKNAEIVSQFNSLADDGVDMTKVMAAIREQDLDALVTLVTEKGTANE